MLVRVLITTAATVAVGLPLAAQPAEAASPAGYTAVRFAAAQVGKPYRYGGAGPHGYDCSGLTSSAWRAAGRRIPRTTRAQFYSLPRVQGPLRPGDLVYRTTRSGRPYHAAVYAGGGRVIVARRSGTRITVQPLLGYWSRNGVKARRPH